MNIYLKSTFLINFSTSPGILRIICFLICMKEEKEWEMSGFEVNREEWVFKEN